MKITSLALSAAVLALTVPSVTARISSPPEAEQLDIKNGQTGGGVHPVTSMDDPRLRNPWAGLNVHSSSAQQKQQRHLARPPAKEKPNKPDKGGGGPGGPGTIAPTPGPAPPANVYKAIIVGAGPGGW